MKDRSATIVNLLMLGMITAAGAVQSAPVPVDEIFCTPGFDGQVSTVRQDLRYIIVDSIGYEVYGATCTWCAGGIRAATSSDTIPATAAAALSGLVYTHCVLDMQAGAKFDLGVAVTNDTVGILLGEVGTTVQSSGDLVNVYPTTNGVRVGSWVRAVIAADYRAMSGQSFRVLRSDGNGQELKAFLTTFRRSDFTNDTGALSFDGIELAGNTGYDPNIVAYFDTPLPLYVRSTTNVLPVTAMTFSPGFDTNPELDGQLLTGFTTAEGSFSSLTGLTCVAHAGVDWIDAAVNEVMPATTNSALSGLKFTQVAANPDRVDWDLGMTVDQSDTQLRFFFGEISPGTTADPVTVVPLSGGQPVGSWKLDIAVEHYGPPSARWKGVKLSSTPFAGLLVSFAITDFTSDKALPPLTNVDGFRVLCPVVGGLQADPNVFGVYALQSRVGTVIIVH